MNMYTLYTVLGIVFYVAAAIGAWKMFEKAGEAGWKALIPFYNIYIGFKISWNTTYFWIWLVLTLVTGWAAFSAYSPYFYTASYMGILASVLELVTLLITVNLCYQLAMSYGHGFWYALGLCFFPYIFTMIIGYGSSRYVGKVGGMFSRGA